MKKLGFLLVAVMAISSCQNKPEKSGESAAAPADTLAYAYDSVKVLSKNLVKPGKNEYADTANAVIKFPTFKNDSLNNYIKRQVFDYIAKEEKVTSYLDIASSFIKGYDDFYKEEPNTGQWWYLLIDIKVLRQTSNYIALEHTHADYTGGAHGNTMVSYINYNPKTNLPVVLDSLIQPGKMADLLKVAETIFRKDKKLSPTETLEGKFYFNKGIFNLPQNFYVSDKGLVFLYNAYEIDAYAAGRTILTIPFAQLQQIAKPNSLLTSTPTH
ncbi:DUF3298 domain-containing protein [Pedobacter sp. KR3-3]|uniref:DUF3298 domain-containing protein n=1 Tax=Pedobacter albus TaxID=3113905 RepID=A0ABU7I582_9SPHI|nr:DUF3298 domain-containing protein [Pedobacter sp. KR3-3]MEE1944623.1 DUF3298 domain-containing protein [Pedobacter sp. KR3-3]